ncbi:alpha-L-fucosidase [Mangrovibacterium sp.]|uniref:alpha-L-fucosidase n=1 Tax=Mangrovibacterium sp. TaxID=1961364 RepID=UPI003566F069
MKNEIGKRIGIIIIGLGLFLNESLAQKIQPTWESMAENYEVPEWFQDGKIGVWMHWGISSAADENRPNDGSHYGRRMYGTEDYVAANEGDRKMTEELSAWHTEFYGHPSEFGYEKLIPLFKAEKWEPDSLVKFVKDCGARFIMPVATHHDNFDMYDSFFPWNSVKMGPKRDILGEWKKAAQKQGLKFGVSTHLYWSPRFFTCARKYQKPGTPEWQFFNMDYDATGFAGQDSWNEHWYARCWDLIEKYDPDMFNNDAPYPDEKTGKSLGVKLFSSFINRNLAQNNGKQTVVFSCKNEKLNRSAFTYNLERGSSDKIQPEPWMWATDLSGGWFYRKGAVNRMSIPVMVGNAVDAISKNGVVMMNIALRGDGTIPENQAAYLTTFGDFLKTCGEGIYGSRPWKIYGEGPLKMKDGRQGENHQNFSQQDIRFTTKDGNLYAFVLAAPTSDILVKTLAAGGLLDQEIENISLLGSDEVINWHRTEKGLTIQKIKEIPNQPVIGFKIVLKQIK